MPPRSRDSNNAWIGFALILVACVIVIVAMKLAA